MTDGLHGAPEPEPERQAVIGESGEWPAVATDLEFGRLNIMPTADSPSDLNALGGWEQAGGAVDQANISTETQPAGNLKAQRRPRNRPTKVCLNCHARRVKCNKRWPCCLQCEKSGTECEWDPRLYGSEGPLSQKPSRARRKKATAAKKSDPTVPSGDHTTDSSGRGQSRSNSWPRSQSTSGPSSLGDNEASLAIPAPDGAGDGIIHLNRQSRLGSFNNYLVTVSRLAPVNELMTLPPVPTKELTALYDLWRTYVDAGREDGTSIMVRSQTAIERAALYNTFCAVASFAHGCVYLNYNTAESLARTLASVSVQLLRAVLGALSAHPEDEISTSLISAVLVFVRVRDVASVSDVLEMTRIYDRLGDILVERGLTYDHPDLPELPTLIAVCDLMGQRRSVVEILERTSEMARARLANPAHLATDPLLWRATSILTQFSCNILVSLVLAEDPSGSMTSVFKLNPFETMPPAIQRICENMREYLMVLSEMSNAHPIQEQTDFILYTTSSILLVFRYYLELYMGVISEPDEVVLEEVRRVIHYQCDSANPTLHDHPLNTPAYTAIAYSLRIISALTDRLEPFLEPLVGGLDSGTLGKDAPILSKKGIALRDICLQLMNRMPDDGTLATRSTDRIF